MAAHSRLLRYPADARPLTLVILAACLLTGSVAGLSLAEDYPSHPVKIIIGFGAGAVADTGMPGIAPLPGIAGMPPGMPETVGL